MHGYKPNFDPPNRSGHKLGRFAKVVNPDGFLQYADGAHIDLHKELTADKSSIQIMPIISNTMHKSGLLQGGMMVVDRSLKPTKGDIVVVRYNEAIVTRRIQKSLTHWAVKWLIFRRSAIL